MDIVRRFPEELACIFTSATFTSQRVIHESLRAKGGHVTDKEFMQVIESYSGSGVAARGVGADICAIYKSVKPILNGILPFLKLIPVWGSVAATAIADLMQVLDATCPGS